MPRGDLFSPDADAAPPVLSADELAAFAANGWAGPFPLLSGRGVEMAGAAYDASTHQFRSEAETGNCRAPDAFVERPWFKSLHARVPLFAEIAAHPAVVNRLRQLLGEDVMLWHGSQNRGSQTRMAMLAQYARPNVRVAIPISWEYPTYWM